MMNRKTFKKRSTVEVRRFGQRVAVIPPVPEVQGQFAMTAHIGVEDKAHGLRVVVTQDDVLLTPEELAGIPHLQAYAGLESRLQTALSNAGYDVELTGDRPAPLRICENSIAGTGCVDRAMLEFVQGHDHGLIRYDPSHVRVEGLVVQIAQAFPETTILILTTRKNDARRLGQQLRDAGLESYVSLDGYEREGPWRIVVTTYGGAGAGIANISYRQMALYLNADEVFCYGGTLGLQYLDRACIFGFLPAGASRPAAVSTLTAAIFGDESVTVLRPGVPTRSVQAVFLPSRVQSPVLRGEDDRAVRERCAWQHPVRNRRIACVAQLLAGTDMQRLEAQLPEVAAKLDPYGWDRVGVLVANVEHGLEMKKYLRDWPLLVAKDFVSEGLSKTQLAKLHEQPGEYWDLGAPAIVTPGALAAAGHFSCIVRADAGSGCLPLDVDQRLASGEQSVPLLILDVDDRHHPVLRRWTRERKMAYCAMGWPVEGGPEVPAECRLPTRQARRPCVLPYQSPTPERWVKGPQRTAEYHYQQRRKHRREQLRKQDGGVLTIQQVADRDHLVDCFRKLVQEGGPAPGIDGISPVDVSLREFGHIAAKLSQVLIKGSYRPQQTRRVAINKLGTDEKRILKIGVLLDRVVGKALHETLQPIWETIYLPRSYGFRPGHSAWQMLAAVRATIEAENRWVLAIDDVRKAFDNVPIAQTLTAHQAVTKRKKNSPAMLSRKVLELIGIVLRGCDENSQVGIDQGGCYSPDALNLLLHVVHDVPFNAADDTPPWYRFADNLVYLCRDVTEGCRVLDRSCNLLARVRMSLKGEDGIVDLESGETAQLLGFAISRINGRVQLGLGRTALPRLRQHLVEVCNDPDPIEAVKVILRLWIGAYGPAFENGEAVLDAIVHLAVETGLREIPGRQVLRQWMKQEYQRWCTCRERVHRQTVRG